MLILQTEFSELIPQQMLSLHVVQYSLQMRLAQWSEAEKSLKCELACRYGVSVYKGNWNHVGTCWHFARDNSSDAKTINATTCFV